MTQCSINSKNPANQIVSTAVTTLFNFTAAIPADNSIPQKGEGTEVLTLSITPIYSTSILEIVFNAAMAIQDTGAGDTNVVIALFQDDTADALTAKTLRLSSSGTDSLFIIYHMVSGTTSSTTFKIRGGSGTNNGGGINQNSAGSQLLGGVAETILTITEYVG